MRKTPVYMTIYEHFKDMLNEGIYHEGDRLPSKRKLAEAFNVSPLTIEAAYQQLIAEGYVYAVEKSGYFVDKQVLLVKSKAIGTESAPIEERTLPLTTYSFKTNRVDTTLFPNATWAKLSRQVLSEHAHEMLNDHSPKGLQDLRNEIQKYLETYRGMQVDTSQIIIGSGSTPLIHLLIDLLGRDKRYAMEDPCYDRIYRVLKGNGVKLSLIPLDEAGLQVKRLEESKSDIVHITPSHQFPMGMVMPIQRRREILNWSMKTGGYIIEDDYDSEFRFSGRPIPSLYGLSPTEHVIYMNTFTKTLAPSFRIGYLVLPKHLLPAYKGLSSYHGSTVPNFEQYILTEFMKQGHFERHINRMRKLYQKKLDIIKALFQPYPFFVLKGHDSGLHFVLEIRVTIDSKGLLDHLNQHLIAIQEVTSYHIEQKAYPFPMLVIGYAGILYDNIHNHFQHLIETILDFIKK